jgi:hypothetical protein
MTIELWIAIIGLIIALGAALTTIWQGFLTRRHNRLSVTPILRIDRNRIPGEPYSIVLRNNGVGPAIIRSIKYLVDGVLIPDNADFQEARAISIIGLNPDHYKLYRLYPGEPFASNESHSIFETMDPIQSNQEARNIDMAFHRLTIEIKYESIYQQKFIIKNP